jgi:hypothetical protein
MKRCRGQTVKSAVQEELVRVEARQIQPTSFEAADIRDFVEMVCCLQPLGAVLAMDGDMYLGELKNALDAGAPDSLLETLAEPRGVGWTVYHEGRQRFNYWSRANHWLVAPARATAAVPIWLAEPPSVLNELTRLLSMFMQGDGTIGYLMTEESDRRVVSGYSQLRPYQKRRFLEFKSAQGILHHRLEDGHADGVHTRSVEYFLQEPGVATIRVMTLFDLDHETVLRQEGPEDVDGVPF